MWTISRSCSWTLRNITTSGGSRTVAAARPPTMSPSCLWARVRSIALAAAAGSVDDAEQAISRVAETGDDEAAVVELLVDRGGDDAQVDRRVGLLLHRLQALRGGQQRHAGDVAGAALMEVLARGDQGVAGGEHRVQHEALPARQIVRQA